MENKGNIANTTSRRYQRYQEKMKQEKMKKRKPFIITGVVLIIAAALVGLWYLDYRKDDPIREQLNQAKAGDAKAQYEVANEYFNGGNVESDYDEGLKWLEKSAEQAYPEAMSLYGVYKLLGAEKVEADLDGAVELFKGAAEQGNNDAKLYLGDIYLTKEYSYYNPEAGVAMLNEAADGGSSVALNLLGTIYNTGEEVAQDYVKAAEYFQRAVDLGDTSAMYDLGLLYVNGNGVDKDEAKGLDFIQQAANGGDTEAATYLEEMNGTTSTEETEEAAQD